MTHPVGTLLLVPAPLEQTDAPRAWLCEVDRRRVAGVRRFYVETPKTARGWLRSLPFDVPIRALAIDAMPPADALARTDWTSWLAPLHAGETVAILSDAGCPGVADPGGAIVAAAHDAGLPVEPLIGPSAILLALMASGLGGQRFAFHGYLPVAPAARDDAIRALARRAGERDETQILIETPYRNQAVTDGLLRALPPEMRLTIAVDVTGRGQSIRTRRVDAWRAATPTLPKQPAVFLFGLR
ncbi:MAG: SAM-dependent methyltransferase [Lautropia sp.]